jgi:broad specificity phosphatase PhoE
MLFLVRHGQTAANADGLLLGRADPALNDLGRRQAAALAAFLPRPERLISSPLRRALDTSAAFDAPIEVDDRWIELDYGDLDGSPVHAVAAELWECWRADAEFAPPGGESLRDLGARVRDACEELREATARGNVVVVSHVSPIKAAVAWVLAAPDELAWRLYVEDAAVARVEMTRHGPMLRSFNEHAPARDL